MPQFRDEYPAAWLFHQNTVRWPFNTIEPDDEPWAEPRFKEYSGVPSIALPAARALPTPLGDAIQRRVSCRNFSDTALSLNELGTILAAGYGIGGTIDIGAYQHLERPVPSGGGLYPLEIYVLARCVDDLQPGVYHYVPLTHELDDLRRITLSPAFIGQLFMNQPYLGNAGAILVITAMIHRSMHKYGDRGYRYILLEAGHVAQNVCLAATALDIGALPAGGFFDGYLADLLGVAVEEEAIVYALAIGHASSDDRVERRNIGALLDG